MSSAGVCECNELSTPISDPDITMHPKANPVVLMCGVPPRKRLRSCFELARPTDLINERLKLPILELRRMPLSFGTRFVAHRVDPDQRKRHADARSGSDVMRELAVRVAGIVGLLCAVLLVDTSGAAVAWRPLGAYLQVKELDSIAKVRCCGWGPRGWYDTWRNCHYCWSGPYCWWGPSGSYSCRWRRR
jgi:hypothetical protein